MAVLAKFGCGNGGLKIILDTVAESNPKAKGVNLTVNKAAIYVK
jgi:hypothetical protein